MHKFLIRAVSGIIYAAVIVCALVYGGWAIWALAVVFAVIGVYEFDRMAMKASNPPLKLVYPIYVIDILAVISILMMARWEYAIYLWIFIMVMRLIARHGILSDSPDLKIAPPLASVYLGIPMAMMVFDPMHRLPLLVFVMLWLNDSGAYIVGSLIGRHKLAPIISPNKTWEGFIGGVAIAMIGSFFLARYCPVFFGMEQYSVLNWMILAVVVCLFGTLGDLLESKIKRTYGVKDSGHLIPGHGGILDRIDSFLLAFPAAFLLLFIL